MESPQFVVKLELLLMVGSDLDDLAHGEGAVQERVCSWELCQLLPRFRDPGSVPQQGERR